jgi:hypothetical protein
MKTRQLLALVALWFPFAAFPAERVTLPTGASLQREIKRAEVKAALTGKLDTVFLRKGVHRVIGNAVISESIYLIGNINDPAEVTILPYQDSDESITHRVMFIHHPDKQIHVVLQGLTVSGGDASYDSRFPGMGGGIYVSGDSLTLEHVRVTGNIASSSQQPASKGWGGGIYNGNGGTTVIKSSSYIGGNFAKSNGSNGCGYGGGVYNATGSSLRVIGQSSIQSNIAAQGQRQIGYGGGLANFGDTLFIEHSDITHNYAHYSTAFLVSDTVRGFGGGIYNEGTVSKPAILKLFGTPGELNASPSTKIRINAAACVFGDAGYDKAYGYGGGIANGANGRIYYSGETLINGNFAIANQHPAVPASGEGYGGGLYQYQDGANNTHWYPDPASSAPNDTLFISGNLAADTSSVGEPLPAAYGHEIWIGGFYPPAQKFNIECDDADPEKMKEMFHFLGNWHWGYLVNNDRENNVLAFTLPFDFQPQISVAGSIYEDIQFSENEGVYRYRLLSNGSEGTVDVKLRVKPYYEVPLKVSGEGLNLLLSTDLSLSFGDIATAYITQGSTLVFYLHIDEDYRGLSPVVTYGGKEISGQQTNGDFCYSLTVTGSEPVICAWDLNGQQPLVKVEFELPDGIEIVKKIYKQDNQDSIEFSGPYIPKYSDLTFHLQVSYPYHKVQPAVFLRGSNDTVKGKPKEEGIFSRKYEYTQENIISQNTTFLINNAYKTIVLPDPPQGFFISDHATGNHYVHFDSTFRFTLEPADDAMFRFLGPEPDDLGKGPDVTSSSLDPIPKEQETHSFIYTLPKGKDHILSFNPNHQTIHFPDSLPAGIQFFRADNPEEDVTEGNNYRINNGAVVFTLVLNSFPEYYPKVAVDGYVLPPDSVLSPGESPLFPKGGLFYSSGTTKDINVTIDRHIVVLRADEGIKLLPPHQHPCDTFSSPNGEFIIEFQRVHDYLTPRVFVQHGRVLNLTEANGTFYCTIQASDSHSDLITGIHIKAQGSTAFDILCPDGIDLVYTSVDPVQGSYCLAQDARFTFSLKIKEPFLDAVPVVAYGGKTLTGTQDGLVWTYDISVVRDAEIEIKLDYVDIRFNILATAELSGLKKESNLLRRGGTYSFSVTAYYPNHNIQPIVFSDQVKYIGSIQEVPGFKTVFNYTLTPTENELIKIHTNYRTLSFSISSSDLTVSNSQGIELPGDTSLTVSEDDRNIFYVIVPGKFKDVLPSVSFNSALIQPIANPVPHEGGFKYMYVVTAIRNSSVNVGLNCAKVVLNGLGNSISLQSPVPTDTFYVTPGTLFKFRLHVAPPYSSVVPAVKLSHTGEYLVPEETGLDGSYDFSFPVANSRLISIDVKLSSYKVILSVLDPGSIALDGGQSVFYFPQATESAPNVLVFTVKVKDGFEYISPRVAIGSSYLRPVSRDKEKYTYVLGNIHENLLVDIQMVYARLKFTLSNGVTLVNTGQGIRPDGYYYLHADSSFSFSLKAPASSPNVAPSVVAGDEPLIPRSLGNGIFAYTFKAKKTGDTEIKVSPYREITFGSDIPADITLRSHSQGTYYAPLGSRFEFTLEVKNSYANVVPNVTVDGNAGGQAQLIDRDDEKNIYRFALEIKDHATLHFALQTLTLRFAALPEGISFINNPGPFAQVNAGGTFSFAVQVDKNHSSIQPYVSAGGNSVTLVSVNQTSHIYTYSITAAKSATVFISLSATTVFLSAKLPEGLELAGTNKEGTYHLSYGQPFSFSVRKSSSLAAGIRPAAHVRTEERTWEILPVVNGEYFNFTLQEVTANSEILVDVNYRTLTLSIPSNDLVLLSPLSGTYDVETGGTFNFSLRAVNDRLTHIPPTVTSKNKLSYTFDQVSGIYNYTLTALYDDEISFKLNAVTIVVELAAEGLALVSPSGLLYGKQVFYAPMGGDCTFAFQTGEYNGSISFPTIIVDQVKLLSPSEITEISTGVFQTTLSQLTKDRHLKVTIPRLNSLSQVDISFLIADGITVNLAGYQYRSTARHTIYQGNLCQFFFQSDEPYLDAGVALLVNGAIYNFTSLGGGNYAVNLGSVIFNTNVQILLAVSQTSTLLTSAHEVKIAAHGNSVTVESQDEVPVFVYSLTGQLLFRRRVQGTDSFSLPAGIYIVRAGNETLKLRISPH